MANGGSSPIRIWITQLPGKAAANGPSVWVFAWAWETRMEVVTARLSWLSLVQSSGITIQRMEELSLSL